MTQPVARRRHIKRWRQCEEIRRDNQLAQTKRDARRRHTTTGNATTSRQTRGKWEERRQWTRGDRALMGIEKCRQS